jgi:hypothetical protein
VLALKNGAGPEVAVNQTGVAFFVWLHREPQDQGGYILRVQARRQSADGTLGPIRTLSTRTGNRSIYTAHVGIDSSGDAVFVWSGGDDRAQARGWGADTHLGPIQNLSPPGRPGEDAEIAVNQDGTAVLAWSRQDRVQARTRAPDGSLGPVETLSASTRSGNNPSVGIDSRGHATIAWQFGADYPCCFIQARTLAGARVSPVQTVSRQGAFGPQVVVDPGGDAVIAWGLAQILPSSAVYARTRDASGKLGPVTVLSTNDHAAAYHEIAMNASGEAAATWMGSGATHCMCHIVASLGP